ncbi:MAG TPA: ABC transporter permease [Bryobacteraceae bacterium]|nr:ABC transporter permease [Bryobacteraceae bacterium]
MWKRLRATFGKRRLDAELDDEVQFHLEMLEQEHRARGLTEEDARLAARRDFGGITQVKEVYRERRGLAFIETFAQDVRYGARVLRRNPAFTLAAVLSLALGIGANTAVFSVFNALLLRAVPVQNPRELVSIRKTGGPQYLSNFSYPLYKQIDARRDLLKGAAASTYAQRARITTRSGGAAGFAWLENASANYFELLGLRPAAGRFFAKGEDTPGTEPVAVVSHDLWRTRFASEPGVVGRAITIDGTPYTVIGVAPAGFRGLDTVSRADIWVPVGVLGAERLANSRFNWLRVVGRRKPGVPLETISAAADTIYRAELHSKGSLNSPWRKIELAMRAQADSAGAGISTLRDRFKEPLTILLALVGMLLMIACANVANLMLARGAARRREMALRLSIGASRMRLVRQCLTEGFLLAALGGVLGLVFAIAGSGSLVAFLPAGDNVTPLDVRPDGTVLLFTAVVSLGSALLFALVPAFRATRVDPGPGLKERGAVHGAPARFGLGRALVAFQVTLSLVLLVGAGLFVRTLASLRTIDPGFRQENVTVFWLDLPKQYKPEDADQLQRKLLDRLSAVPGVLNASCASLGPYMSGKASSDVTVDTPAGPKQAYVDQQYATPAYFATLGIPLLRGRVFDEHDKNVAVVSELFVEENFGREDPIGRRLSINGGSIIVGVVRDVLQQGLREKPAAMMYLPMSASRIPRAYVSYQVRTAAAPDGMIETFRRELASIDPIVALTDARSLAARVDESLMRERLLATLSGFFGALALALAAVGLYGVLSYSVARRTGEIGVRMALGAARGTVLWGVIRDAAVLIGVGIAAGLTIALAAARVTASLLFGIEPKDAATYIAAAGLLAMVALLASWFPARRAASISPTQALRHE